MYLVTFVMKKTNPALTPLYSRYLSSCEKRSLRHVPPDESSSEINLLRVLNSLLLKIQQSTPKDLYSRMQALRTSVILNEQLAYLVRSRDREIAHRSELDDSIEAAIESMADDWKDA